MRWSIPLARISSGRSILKEPLFLYFVLAAGLFVLTHGRDEGNGVLIDSPTRQEVAAQFRDQHGEAPSRIQLERAIKKWTHEEILYLEGLRRGLDKNDPIIRGRVVARLRELEQRLLVPIAPPSEVELTTWLEDNLKHYQIPTSFDYEIVELPPGFDLENLESRIEALKRKGILHGNLKRAQGQDRTTANYGRVFARRLSKLALNKWSLVTNGSLTYLVRLERRRGGLPPKAQLHPRLVADWKEERTRRALSVVEDAIHSEYVIKEVE